MKHRYTRGWGHVKTGEQIDRELTLPISTKYKFILKTWSKNNPDGFKQHVIVDTM